MSRELVFEPVHDRRAASPDRPRLHQRVRLKTGNQRLDQLLLQGARHFGVRDDPGGLFDQPAGGGVQMQEALRGRPGRPHDPRDRRRSDVRFD